MYGPKQKYKSKTYKSRIIETKTKTDHIKRHRVKIT